MGTLEVFEARVVEKRLGDGGGGGGRGIVQQPQAGSIVRSRSHPQVPAAGLSQNFSLGRVLRPQEGTGAAAS